MSLLQFMLTGSPGYSKEVPRKKVMSAFLPLSPEVSISWEEQVPPFSRHVSAGYVLEKMDFLQVFREHLHQRKLIPSSGGGQWRLLMLPLKQSPMTNSPQTEEVTDAVKLSGWFREHVNPNCHQCWQGPRNTDCVYTSWYQVAMQSQTSYIILAKISQELFPAILFNGRTSISKIKINRDEHLISPKFLLNIPFCTNIQIGHRCLAAHTCDRSMTIMASSSQDLAMRPSRKWSDTLISL